VAITFSEGVNVGKSSLTSVMLSTVKGDCLCDYESGTSDVARAQVSASALFVLQRRHVTRVPARWCGNGFKSVAVLAASKPTATVI
jgi:hypothetical protein